jgi:hypothetical protein
MTHHILQVATGDSPNQLPWRDELHPRGIVLLQAANMKQAVHFCQAYSLMAILLEIDRADERTLEEIRSLPGLLSGKSPPPIIGLNKEPLSDEDRERLAQAGLSDLVAVNDSPSFLLWRLKLLAALDDLRRFEQSRIDVTQLAHETRDQLHNLSQPLSALQGRLQLLMAKCAKDDPHAETFKMLVELIFAVSGAVIEIQQLHRQYS